jgi:hypothetical protein
MLLHEDFMNNHAPAFFENNICANVKTELYCSPASTVKRFKRKVKACLTAKKGVAYNLAVWWVSAKLISM